MRNFVARGAGATVAVLMTLLVGALPAGAKPPPPGCTGGRLLFVDGPLRIVAIPFGDEDGTGTDIYACLGARGRPTAAGSTFFGTGVATSQTPQFVFDGARYLAILQQNDGEGGPDASYDVLDLKTRRRVRSRFTAYLLEPPAPPVRVTTFGDLLMPAFAATLKTVELLAGPKPSLLSTPGANAHTIALKGRTAYWTEQVGAAAPVARFAPVRNSATARENHPLEPVSIPAARSRCASRKGTTIAASPHVRVLRSQTAHSVCRVGSNRLTALGSRGGSPQIMADRWLLSRSGAEEGLRLIVRDTESRKTVTNVVVRPGTETTLLADGTLAWLPAGGPLAVQTAAATAPTVVAAATDMPSGLASAAGTIYWTAGGAPHRYSISASR